MPIYEYLCEDCGRITELMQKVTEPPPRSCGECGSKKIAKLVSRSAFQLKGGGWYADLYSSTKKDGAKSESKSAGAGASAKAATAGKGADRPAEKKATEAKKSSAD